MNNKIYLAGGMQSGWQSLVIESLPNQTFFNPATHGLGKPEEYTVWDFHHIKQCDILLGYMEKDNPSGYGLAGEIGFAHALNKTIILVDERSFYDVKFLRHFAIINNLADVTFRNLDSAINYLRVF